MSTVRPDMEIVARNGDGALFVQIDHKPNTADGDGVFIFTMAWAMKKGTPPHVALKDMARFILERK